MMNGHSEKSKTSGAETLQQTRRMTIGWPREGAAPPQQKKEKTRGVILVNHRSKKIAGMMDAKSRPNLG